MKNLPYILVTLALCLFSCNSEPCVGFNSEPALDINENNVYEYAYSIGKKGEKIYYTSYSPCNTTGRFTLPIDFTSNSFTFYLYKAGKTDTITLGYGFESSYTGEDCGYRFTLTDMKVLSTTVPVSSIGTFTCYQGHTYRIQL